MKIKSLLSFVVLLASALACGLPSAAPAEPTVNALPPTPNLPFSASPAPQNPTAGNQPPSAPQFSNTIREEFDGKLSPGLGWTWLRQDNANWSLAAAPGRLRINLSTSSYPTGLPSNVLTTAAPAGDFDIRTLVRFVPTANFEMAGLIVIFEERTVLQLGRVYCDLGSCIGSGYYFDNPQNGSAVGGNFGTTGSSGESVLRLVRQGEALSAANCVGTLLTLRLACLFMQPLNMAGWSPKYRVHLVGQNTNPSATVNSSRNQRTY